MKTAVNIKKGLFASTIHVTLLILLNVIVSFSSQLLIAYYFGTNTDRDAYFSAVVIPTYITAVFTGSFVVVFLPELVSLLEKNLNEAVRFASTIIMLSAVLMSIIALLGVLYSDVIISITSYGFNSLQLKLSSQLLKILMPTVVFQSLTGLFASVYQAHHKFIAATIAPIFSPIVVVAILFFFVNDFGIETLAMGSLLGSFFPAVFLFTGLLRTKKIAFAFNIRNNSVRHVVITSAPLFITGILYRLTGVFERMIASNLSTGSISFLGYANQLATTLGTIITGGIATTIFPHMAQAWAANEKQQFYRYITRGITIVFLSCFPIIALVLALGEPIIQIVFERGAFSHSSTQAVALTFQILMGSFLFSSLGGITIKALYVMSKTKTVAFIAVTEIIIYLLMGFWLSDEYSYKGLATALSISAGVNIILCIVILFFFQKEKGLSVIGSNVWKIIVAASIEFFMCRVVLIVLPNETALFLKVAISSLVGVVAYFYLTVFMLNVDEAHMFREKIVRLYHNLFGFADTKS
ncbi:MAG: lipid II flippase MurJ [Bacteroidota bacterium]|nr:lipid II flippase MurJ [Bacteroidota bacterium]